MSSGGPTTDTPNRAPSSTPRGSQTSVSGPASNVRSPTTTVSTPR